MIEQDLDDDDGDDDDQRDSDGLVDCVRLTLHFKHRSQYRTPR